jgi:hypothetical protein
VQLPHSCQPELAAVAVSEPKHLLALGDLAGQPAPQLDEAREHAQLLARPRQGQGRGRRAVHLGGRSLGG